MQLSYCMIGITTNLCDMYNNYSKYFFATSIRKKFKNSEYELSWTNKDGIIE
jgi:hypothetical protein